MRIAHLSDLHFGADDADVAAMVAAALRDDIKPDLTIISGDFTQTGSRREFSRAAEFLRGLPGEHFCVPGNHDVPARDLAARFFDPYERFTTAIGLPQPPVFSNDKVVVAGINSARRALPHWNWANGAISEAQRQYLAQVFEAAGPAQWKITVMHHPVHKDVELPMDVTVFGRKRTLRRLRALAVDLVLTGHTHYAGLTTIGDAEHSTVYLNASTALSTRRRGREGNGFNVIDIDGDRMIIRALARKDAGFVPSMTYEHRRR